MNESLSTEETSPVTRKRRGKYCAAFDCNNSAYDINGTRTSYHFFEFPKDAQRRKRWCSLIKRRHGQDGFVVSTSTVLCHEHFRTEDISKKLTGRWILKKGAEPCLFSWTLGKKQRKAPAERMQQVTDESTPESVGEAVSALHVGAYRAFSSDEPSTSAAGSLSQFDENAVELESETPQTEPDIFLELQRKIALLEIELADCQEKLCEAEKEKAVLLERQFSLEKIKDDNAAVLFYTGFPSYDALISVYKYIEPKLAKMQYWKGENLLKESQPYQTDDNKRKPGPSRKLSYLDEFLLVLMRLKAGLFVQDLADRFGISTSLVSRICITWINLLYYEMKELFPFPTQELVRKNMPKEFAQYATTRIILDCTELFIQRPSAMLAQSETWSDYKHHNTWKLLVGVTPNGQHQFVYMDIAVGHDKIGRLLIELFPERLPKTCKNFLELCLGSRTEAERHNPPLKLWYKNSIFHRIVPNGWIQGGDIEEGKGIGGESIYGPFFEDEDFSIPHGKRGIVGMANRGRHTNGSQFFITLQPAPWMDTKYVAFGQVIEGARVLDELEKQETFNERPKSPCVILDCGLFDVEGLWDAPRS